MNQRVYLQTYGCPLDALLLRKDSMSWRDRLWLRVKQACGNRLYEFIRATFHIWERLGVHLTMNHYYEPVPDTRRLPASLWHGPSEVPGIALRESAQLELVRTLAAAYKAEYDAFPTEPTRTPYQFYVKNAGFPPVDAEMLYGIIRHVKPSRVVEIGSGNSTYLSAQALIKNSEDTGTPPGALIAIEPYPNPVLRQGFPGLTRLISQPVQAVPLSEFMALGEHDILFIDSSHMLKIGSDVQYEYLELLPRLRPGVMVHIHDIHLPYEYPKDLVLGSRRFWNEQYLLQAFLAFNDRFEVLWASCYMHHTHPQALEKAFRSYHALDRWPSSLWLRRVA